MNIVQIDNWRDYLRDGEKFLQTAIEAHKKKRKAFSADTLYNVTCMAIEKLIIAFLMKNGDLADNHAMADLLRALQLHLGDIDLLAHIVHGLVGIEPGLQTFLTELVVELALFVVAETFVR